MAHATRYRTNLDSNLQSKKTNLGSSLEDRTGGGLATHLVHQGLQRTAASDDKDGGVDVCCGIGGSTRSTPADAAASSTPTDAAMPAMELNKLRYPF